MTEDALASTHLESSQSIRRAAKGSALGLSGAAISALATFGLTVVITRGASREEAGVYFAATSLFVLATSLGQLGTSTGLVYFISRARAAGQTRLVRRYNTVALVPVVALAVAASLVILVFSHEFGRMLVPDHPEETARALVALALFIPAAGIENVYLSSTRGLGTMRPYTAVEQITRPCLQFVLAAALINVGTGLSLSWSWSVAYGPAAVLAWRAWRTRTSSLPLPPVADEPIAAEFWRFTGPRSLASVAQIAMQRLDVVLVGALAGASAAALYAAATRFIVVGQVARNAVSLAVQPHLASALAAPNHRHLERLYQVSTAWLMIVTWPLFLILLLDGHALLRVFGKGYDEATAVLVILAISMLIATLCGDVDSVLIMAGRTSRSLANVALAFAVNLGLDIWLIPSHGVTGAAIGWSASIALKNVAALVQVNALLRLQPIGRATTLVVAANAGAWVVCLIGCRVIMGTGNLGLLTSCLSGASVYLAILWAARRPLHLHDLSQRRRGKYAVTA